MYLTAASRLHRLMLNRFWDGTGLSGPDNGVRVNARVGRFIKSYLDFIPWRDDYRYLQAQGYWVHGNWLLYDQFHEDQTAQVAVQGAYGILRTQRSEGYWDYPNPEWGGRIGTVEGNWAALGLLSSYERTREDDLLKGAIAWHGFLENQIGYQKAGPGIAVNYFAGRSVGIVPNVTSLTLAFLGRLAEVSGDRQFLEHCSDMIAFLASVQSRSGEIPYSQLDQLGLGRNRPHFQCYQYNAFELLDLAFYYGSTADSDVLPIIRDIAKFIGRGVGLDGHVRFDCGRRKARVIYHTAAVAAALAIAGQLDLHYSPGVMDRAGRYLLAQQDRNGGFGFSKFDYWALADSRYYPRPHAMILFHLLVLAESRQGEPLKFLHGIPLSSAHKSSADQNV